MHALSTLLRRACLATVLACAFALSLSAQQPGSASPGERRQGAGQRPPRILTWLMPKVEGANLHYEMFDSQAAGEKVSYLIYLPPGYEKSSDRRYPVVYWLHGIGGSQQGVPAICDRLTEAMVAGKAPEMIMVFVTGMIDSFWCDAINVKRPVETAFIKELIPLIDASYRTIATREGRMIEGFSMGGFGAGHFGFKYPELFGSVSMLDGALLSLDTIKTRHAEIFQRVWNGQDELFEADHPSFLAEKNLDRIKGRTVVRQAVGVIVGENRALAGKLRELGIEEDYVETGARHNPGEVYAKLGDANWAFYRRAFASIPAGKGATTTAQDITAARSGAVAGFTLEDTRWTYDHGDLKMEGILMKPQGDGPFPAILISHGRGGNAAGFGIQKAQAFVKMGFVCIAPDYTHAGRGNGVLAGGGAPGASPENLKRAAKCLDILQSLPYVDSNRLAAYGNSMGAFITVSLSASEADRLKATAITAGGIRTRDGGSIIPSADIPQVPMCILHGGADGTVPPGSSASLKELLDQNHTPNERHVFDGIGHNLHQQKAGEVFGLIKAWFIRHGVLQSG